MFPSKLFLISVIFTVLFHLQGSQALTLREEMFLTDEQQIVFNRFKTAALAIIPSGHMRLDLVLIKYFRFCDMSDTKALELLKENLKWRLDLGFEALTEDEIASYERILPYSTFKDKLGRGIFFVVGKYWDMAAATSSSELSKKFARFTYHMMEEAFVKGVSNSTNRTASGIVVIVDIHEVDLTKGWCPACLTALKEVISQTEIRWPGGLQAVYLPNVPTFLTPTLPLLRGALSKRIQESVFTFDENDAFWMPVLLSFIAAEKIPGELYVRSQVQAQSIPGTSSGFNLFALPPPPGPPATEQGGSGKKKDKKEKNKSKQKSGQDDDDDAGLD